jgi:hypothetical protein
VFSSADLLVQIENGLHESWRAAFSTNDTPFVSMKPEYLTTVVLGLHLSSWLQKSHPTDKYIVRFEEKTKDVATRAFAPLPLPYRPKNVHGRAKKESGEEGSVDLVLYKNQSFFPETIAIFEIKNFDQPNVLLIKDIERNIEFMELTDPAKQNQIQFSVLTFFLHDKNSVIQEQAKKFLAEKTSEFSAIAARHNRNGISSSLTLKTLVNYPNLSNKDALELDTDGRPAIESEENHHIAFGIILLQRNIVE